jgi:glycosyltransferase involved in cell wall biosynthesis
VKLIYITRLKKQSNAAHSVQIAAFTDALKEIFELEIITGDTVSNNLWKSINPFYISRILFYIFAVFKAISNGGHIYTRDCNFGIFLATILPKRKICIEFHNLTMFPLLKSHLKRCRNIIYFPINAQAKSELDLYKHQEGVIITLPSASPERKGDIKNFSERLNYFNRISQDQCLILHTGSLQKYLPEMLIAFANSLDARYFFLHVGGTFEACNKLNSIVENKNALFHERIDNADVLALQGIADVGLLLISKKWENFNYTSPLKLFEYLSSDLPVLCTKAPATIEVFWRIL